MVKLYGQEWTAAELRRHVGSMDQLAGIVPGERTDGTARGVRTLDVQTGSGLSFTVLPEIPDIDRSRQGFLYAITVAGKDVEGRLASTTLHLYAPNPIVHRSAPFPDLRANGRDPHQPEDPGNPDRESRASVCEIKGLHLVIRELKYDRSGPDFSESA